jgi:hypothetical protein
VEDVAAACRDEQAKRRQQDVARRAGRGVAGRELEDADRELEDVGRTPEAVGLARHRVLLGLRDEVVDRAERATRASVLEVLVFAAKLERLA